MTVPDGFWGGIGTFLAGGLVGISLWVSRLVGNGFAPKSEFAQLRNDHTGLAKDLQVMHAQNLEKLRQLEEAQVHMPSRHIVNNMDQRLRAVESATIAVGEQIKAIAGSQSEQRQDTREVKNMLVSMMQRNTRRDESDSRQ